MPKIHIVADWPERADTRGWRIAEVVALDENGNKVLLQIISATKPVQPAPQSSGDTFLGVRPDSAKFRGVRREPETKGRP